MKIYKVELSIIDFDNIGEKEIVEVIQNAHYPNHCISPNVKRIESREIGKWRDDNPLNFKSTADAEFKRLFAEEQK